MYKNYLFNKLVDKKNYMERILNKINLNLWYNCIYIDI